MQTDRYLRRLGVTPPIAPSIDELAHLQQAHLLTTPFENLSVRAGEPIVLDERLLVEKLAERQRGGFCYELNGAFGWLLRQLGFAVTRISARVYSGERQTFGPEFDHMALIVHLDQDYLVDVGFGDSARGPIPVPAGETEDVSGRYRVRRNRQTLDEFVLQRYERAGWSAQYAFTSEPRQLADYAEMCHYHSHSPASHFTQRTVCTLATPTGRLTLTPDAFTVTEGASKQKQAVGSQAEFDALLLQHFGIRRSPTPDV